MKPKSMSLYWSKQLKEANKPGRMLLAGFFFFPSSFWAALYGMQVGVWRRPLEPREVPVT